MAKKKKAQTIEQKDKKLITWNQKNKDKIQSNLQEVIKVTKNGALDSFFKTQSLVNILSYSIQIKGIDSIDLKRGFVFQTALRLPKLKKQDLPTFRRVLATIVRKHLKEPKKEYSVILPLNVSRKNLERRRLFNVLGTRLKIQSWNYIDLHFDIKKWFSKRPEHSKYLFSKSVPLVAITMGRNYREAFWEANEAFRLLRSIFNLTKSFFTFTIQGGAPQPLGKILPPPVYGVFKNGGDFDNYYYEAVDLSRHYNKVILSTNEVQNTYRLLKLLRQPKDSEDINGIILSVLRNYGSALETFQWRDAFLDLWQILEMITFRPTETFSMAKVCERIKALFNNQPFLSDLLWTSLETRNKLVHLGIFPEEGLTDVSMLKSVVEHCINMLFNNRKLFPTWQRLQLYYKYSQTQPRHLAECENVIKAIQNIKKRKRKS